METILNSYYENNAKKLHTVVNQIFYKKFGGIQDKDMDEFYSVANDVFFDIIKNNRYDSSKGEFDGFLYRALSLAFIDEFKRQNRNKRVTKIELADEDGKVVQMILPDIYLDTPIDNAGNSTLGDVISGSFDMEKEIFEGKEEMYSEKVQLYLGRLSDIQRDVLRLIIAGYLPNEIREELHLTKKQYADCYAAIHAYRNVSILF